MVFSYEKTRCLKKLYFNITNLIKRIYFIFIKIILILMKVNLFEFDICYLYKYIYLIVSN